MRIAPDVDKLMWTLAESGQPLAVEDFQGRFPELKVELSRRVQLMQDLRNAKA